MRLALAAALEAVALRLEEHEIPYLLGGSALLHALGLPGEVGDVDLMLRAEDRARFEAATAAWWRATTTEPAGRLRSAWKATLDVGGEEVEGLGGFALGAGDRTVTLPWRGAGTWRCGDAAVPLAAPELWWAVYLEHKPEKARALEAIVGPAARARVAAELGLDPTEWAASLVPAGYDTVAEGYLQSIADTEGDPRLGMLEAFAERVLVGGAVLDLGCGAGAEGTERLVGRFRVTGVDVSPRQLALASERLPAATFVQADMAELDLPPRSFDGVVALYSITHVPRERHRELFRRIAGWLRPGGLFLAALGSRETTGVGSEDWLGVPMFFSHSGAATNRRLLRSAGFELLVDEEVAMKEADGVEATFLWVLARVNP